MSVTKSAKKKERADKKKRQRNILTKGRALSAIDKLKKSPGSKTLMAAFSAIDKAAKKKVFHGKKADRLKSRLAKLLPLKS
ncbi:30S ribosomal protein S20 [Candidatus Collierbacteria bacterium]|nr:30S ribosomal protein S20 [Candidatus Collierbacteria bacterium]